MVTWNHLTMRRRLFILSMMAELLALTGFAIPASLTLIALNNAASAEPIQELLLHAKSTAPWLSRTVGHLSMGNRGRMRKIDENQLLCQGLAPLRSTSTWR